MQNQKNIEITVKVLFVLIILTFIVSLFLRNPNGDEAILAEQSYWLSKIGYVKSVMFTGLGFGWEYIQYHYHKLFIVSGAIVIKLIGVSEIGLRIFVLLFSLLMLYFLYQYCKKVLNFNKLELLTFFLFLLFQFHFFYFSFIFRPEIPVVCLGFISFYFLNKYISEKNIKYLMFSSFLSGLSALMHLNGLVFIVSGLILLMIKKDFKGFIYFLIISLLTTLIYFFNITTINDFNLFLYQFANDPNLHKADFSIILKFGKLISEHLRYFHSPKEIVLSLLFFFALIVNYKKLYKKHSNLIIYTFALLFSLAVIAHDKTDKYSLIYIPFMIIIITLSLINIKYNHKIIRKIFPVLISLYFIVNSIFIFNIIGNHVNLIDTNKYYAKLMPKKNVSVLTREDFFFNEIYNFNIISILSFEYKWKRLNEFKAKSDDFYQFANTNNIYYILIENKTMNSEILSIIDFDNIKLNQVYWGYRVNMKNDKFVLLQRVN